MASSVDVGDLPNHVKYCVSVLSLQWAVISTSPVKISNISDILRKRLSLQKSSGGVWYASSI